MLTGKSSKIAEKLRKENCPLTEQPDRLRKFEVLKQRFMRELQAANLLANKKTWQQLIYEMEAALTEEEFQKKRPEITRLLFNAHREQVAKYQIARYRKDAIEVRRRQQNFNVLGDYIRAHEGNPHPPRDFGSRFMEWFVGWDTYCHRKFLWNGWKKKSDYEAFSQILRLGPGFTLPRGMKIDPNRKKFFANLAVNKTSDGKNKKSGRLLISGVIWKGGVEPYKNATLLHKIKRFRVPLNVISFLAPLETMGGNTNHLLYDFMLPRDLDIIKSRGTIIRMNGAEVLTSGNGHPGVSFEYDPRYDHGFENMASKDLPYRGNLQQQILRHIEKLRNGEDVAYICSGGKSRSCTHTMLTLIELGMTLEEASKYVAINRAASEGGFTKRNASQKCVLTGYFLEKYTGLNLSSYSQDRHVVVNMLPGEIKWYLDGSVERCRKKLHECRVRLKNVANQSQYNILNDQIQRLTKILNGRLESARYRQQFLQMTPEYIAKNLALIAMLNTSASKGRHEIEELKKMHPGYVTNTLFNLKVFWSDLCSNFDENKMRLVLQNLDVDSIVQLHELLIQAGCVDEQLACFESIIASKVVSEIEQECKNYHKRMQALLEAKKCTDAEFTVISNLIGYINTLVSGPTSIEQLRSFKSFFNTQQLPTSLVKHGFLSGKLAKISNWLNHIPPERIEFEEKCSRLFSKVIDVSANDPLQSHSFFAHKSAKPFSQELIPSRQLLEEEAPHRSSVAAGV